MRALVRRIAPVAATALVAPLVAGVFSTAASAQIESVTDPVDECGEVPSVSQQRCEEAPGELREQLPATTVPPTTTTSLPTDEAEKPVLSIGDAVKSASDASNAGEVKLSFPLTLNDPFGDLEGSLPVPFEVAPVVPADREWFTVDTNSPVTIDPTDSNDDWPTIDVIVDTSKLATAVGGVLTVELFSEEDPGSESDDVVVAKRFGVGAVVEDPTELVPEPGDVVPRPIVVVGGAVGTRGATEEPTDATFRVVAVPPPDQGEAITVDYRTKEGDLEAAPEIPEVREAAQGGTDYEEETGSIDLTADEPVDTVSVTVKERDQSAEVPLVAEFTLEVTNTDNEGFTATRDGIGRIVTVPDATGMVEDTVTTVSSIVRDAVGDPAEGVPHTAVLIEDAVGFEDGTMSFTVRRIDLTTDGFDGDLSVPFEDRALGTGPIAAQEPEDYEVVNSENRLVFSEQEDEKTIDVEVKSHEDATGIRGPRTFEIELFPGESEDDKPPSGVQELKDIAIGVISDDLVGDPLSGVTPVVAVGPDVAVRSVPTVPEGSDASEDLAAQLEFPVKVVTQGGGEPEVTFSTDEPNSASPLAAQPGEDYKRVGPEDSGDVSLERVQGQDGVYKGTATVEVLEGDPSDPTSLARHLSITVEASDADGNTTVDATAVGVIVTDPTEIALALVGEVIGIVGDAADSATPVVAVGPDVAVRPDPEVSEGSDASEDPAAQLEFPVKVVTQGGGEGEDGEAPTVTFSTDEPNSASPLAARPGDSRDDEGADYVEVSDADVEDLREVPPDSGVYEGTATVDVLEGDPSDPTSLARHLSITVSVDDEDGNTTVDDTAVGVIVTDPTVIAGQLVDDLLGPVTPVVTVGPATAERTAASGDTLAFPVKVVTQADDPPTVKFSTDEPNSASPLAARPDDGSHAHPDFKAVTNGDVTLQRVDEVDDTATVWEGTATVDVLPGDTSDPTSLARHLSITVSVDDGDGNTTVDETAVGVIVTDPQEVAGALVAEVLGLVDETVESATPVVAVGPAVAVRPRDDMLEFPIRLVGGEKQVKDDLELRYSTSAVLDDPTVPLAAEAGEDYMSVSGRAVDDIRHVAFSLVWEATATVEVLDPDPEGLLDAPTTLMRHLGITVTATDEDGNTDEKTAVGAIVTDPAVAALGAAGQLPEASIDKTEIEVLEPPAPAAGEGPAQVTISVTVGAPRATEATVDWEAVDGQDDEETETGAKAGDDYGTEGDPTPPSGTLTFPVGTEPVTQNITVDLLADTEAHGNLSFDVDLTDVDGATEGDVSSRVTIVDDETIVISIEEAVEFDEPTGDDGTPQSTEQIEVSMSPPQHSRAITVPVSAQDGTATSGTHYEVADGTKVEFPGDESVDLEDPEAVTETFDVTLFGDRTYEAGEERSFTVELGEPLVVDGNGVHDDSAEISVGSGTAESDTPESGTAEVTVSDADAAPTVSVEAEASRRSGETGEECETDEDGPCWRFEITRTFDDTMTKETALDTIFEYETKSDTAQPKGKTSPPGDYTHTEGSHTFPTGSGEGSLTVDVSVNPAGTGSFDFALSDLQGAELADAGGSASVDLGVVDGHVVALTEDTQDTDEHLVSFDPEKPGVPTALGEITGVASGHQLLAVEFDGAGNLYALARATADNTPRFYRLSYPTDPEGSGGGVVSAEREPLFACSPSPAPEACAGETAPAPELTGTAFDLAWVPASEGEGDSVFRVAGDDGQHLRIDLDATGAKATPGLPFRDAGDPAGDAPALAGVSYSPSVPPDAGESHPLLYGIDVARRTLVHETGEFEPPVDPDQVVGDVEDAVGDAQDMLPDVPPEGVPPEGVPPEPPASPSSHDDPAGVADDPTSAPDLLARGAVTELGPLGVPSSVSGHASHVGFDVGHDGVAYLTAFDGNTADLYTVDLGQEVSGERAVERGQIGKTGFANEFGNVMDIAVEPAGIVQFEQSAYSTTEPDAGESEASLSVAVEREHGVTGELTVPYSVDDEFEPDDGHSRAQEGEGEDFELADGGGGDDDDGVDDGVLTFGNDDETVTIDVTVPGDDDWQGDRQFALALGQPSGAAGLGERQQVIVTIGDGDPGTVSIDDTTPEDPISVAEGDAATINVQRTGGSEGRLLVDLVTVEVDEPDGQDREPATKDDDYTHVQKTLSWDPGEEGDDEQRTVAIETFADGEVEGDEIVDFKLTNARLVDENGNPVNDDSLLGSNSGGTLVIREVKPGQVQLSTDTLAVDEGLDEEVVVDVVRTGGGSGEIRVDWSAQDGTGDSGAEAGTDYEDDENGGPPSGTLTFGHGDDEKSFTIAVLDNEDFDGDRTFTVTLEVDGYTTEHDGTEPDQLSDLLGDPAEIGITIADEDIDKTGGKFAFETDDGSSSPIEVEVREDAGVLELPVVRTKAGSGTVTVDWSAHSTESDTAVAGTDYGEPNDDEPGGTVTFGSKQLGETVAVPIIDDSEVEGPRTFTVTLTGADLAGAGEPDEAPTVVEPAEAGVTIRDIEPGRAYAVAEDDDGIDRLVSFNPVLPGRDDGDGDNAAEVIGAIDELDDQERVEGAVFGSSGGTFHVLGVEDIENENGEVVYQQARVYTLELEGHDGPTVTGTAVFTVETASAFGVTFDAAGNLLVATTEGELVVVGSDGDVESTPLDHETSGESPRIGALTTAPDGTVYGLDIESDQGDALVRLGGPGGANPSPSGGQVTTVASLAIDVADAPAALDVDTDGVVYALVDSDGDSVEELHRVFVDGSGDVSAGSTLLLASLGEGIAGVSGFGSLAVATAGVLDLDAPASAAESDGRVDVPVVRSEGTFGAVGASYEVRSGSGTLVDSGGVAFDDGDTSATITHTWTPSEVYDDDRQVTVRLTDPTGGASLGDGAEATITVENDNPPPTISAGRDVSVVERGDGAVARVRLHLSGATNKAAQVTARTVDGTATAGRDYTATRQTVTFPAGATTRTVDVGVRALESEAPQRRFRLVLSAPTDATVGDSAATVTVTRDYPEPPASPTEPVPEPGTEVQELVVEPAPRGNVTPSGDGYWIPSPVGTVEAFGDAAPVAGISGRLAVAFNPEREIVDVASDQTGEGVWLLERSGGVHALGSAQYHGSIPERRAQGFPIGTADAASIAATPSGNGYAILDEDGGIHTFGDARYHGSIPQRRAEGLPIGVAETVDIAMSPTGDGYVVLEDNGGVHTFGDARYHGSIPALRLAGVPVGDADLASIALAPGGDGYWILDEHGGVHTFGEARYRGSIPALQAAGQPIGIAGGDRIEATASGEGYWIFDRAGGVFTFGDAPFRGSVPGRAAG